MTTNLPPNRAAGYQQPPKPAPKPGGTYTTGNTPADRAKAGAQATQAQDSMLAIRETLLSESSLAMFQSMMSTREARYYVNSVLMTVAYSPQLQLCTRDSILKCAVRAAALEMSCDEGLHQGQLVPYKGQAKLIIHYLGVVNLAQRTGKFETINWGPIQKGETITFDKLSGIHVITGEPESETAPVLGYFAYFLQKNGYHKSAYMTLHQIHTHAQKWAPSYSTPGSAWNDPKKLPAMEQKTVIRMLMKQADLSGKDKAAQQLAASLADDDFVADEDDSFPAEWTDLPDEGQAATQTTQAAPAPKPATPETKRPYTPEYLREYLRTKTNEIGIYQARQEETGLMCGMMELAFAPDPNADKIRRSCIRYLFQFDSSKKMKGPQIKACLDWLNAKKDSGGSFSPDPVSVQELHAVWTAAQLEKGQEILPGMEAQQ